MIIEYIGVVWCVSVHEILIPADGIGDSGNER